MQMNRYAKHYGMAGALIVAATLTACATPAVVREKPQRKIFFFPVRQLAAEPVYNRITKVYLPQVLPARTVRDSAAPLILPVLQLELKNATLEEAARTLALSSRYSYYCSSVIAKRNISIQGVGNVDELASQIENKAGIKVVVDHGNHEIRFMAGSLDRELPEGLE